MESGRWPGGSGSLSHVPWRREPGCGCDVVTKVSVWGNSLCPPFFLSARLWPRTWTLCLRSSWEKLLSARDMG